MSLTESCNFKCVYCTPDKGLALLTESALLSPEEIERFVRVASSLGIRRVRLTGGEPLLRKEIVEITRLIAGLPGVEDLSLTTNGSLLAPLLQPLKAAGLGRINISLDSLDRRRFQEITGVDGYEKVFQIVFAALRAGFPVKLNVVALSGLGEDEIVRFAELACLYRLDVRFLEFMPLCGPDWKSADVLNIGEIRDIVRKRFVLRELPRADAPAQTFAIDGGQGRIGFIGSLTESFCHACSRFRLSADGTIFPCLFSEIQVPVKAILRGGSDEDLVCALQEAARLKPKGNQFRETPFTAGAFVGTAPIPAPRIRRIGG